MKEFIKSMMALTPYRIVRSDKSVNRFQGICTCLKLLRKFGYRPSTIIDGGAHLGDFALQAKIIFPESIIHLIEPQPACRKDLEALSVKHNFLFHPYALVSEAEALKGYISLTIDEGPTTGAHISLIARGGSTVSVTTSTLDQLFERQSISDDHTFLKLDLQGYELAALSGGEAALKSVEVILTEVSFFAQAYEPSIAMLISFLNNSGFDLFDIAALSGRTRDNRLKQGDLVFVKRGSPLLADTRWG
jgi:FkbM family methyltransferase